MIEVPDFACRHSQRLREYWRPLYPDTHLFHFTEQTLRKLVEQCGFRVAKIRRYGGLGVLSRNERKGNPARLNDAKQDRGSIRKMLFDARRFVYAIPGGKRLARHLYWHVLRMNEYVRLLAVKR